MSTKQIVIFMPRFIGDCINCTPAIKLLELSYPDAQITLVLRAVPALVFSRNTGYKIIIDERLSNKLRGILSLVKTLKKQNYDAAILMTNTLIDAVITKASGINNVIGYAQEMRKPLLKKALKLDTRRHYINRYAYLANAFCNNKHSILPDVNLFFDKKQSVLLNIDTLKVGFCIVNKAKLSRHYPTGHCAKTIELINQKVKEPLSFFLIGSPEEMTEAEQVVATCQKSNIENVQSIAGKTTILELIDTIADLDLLITVDSGPLHIAAATKTSTIALHSKGTSAFSTVCPKGPQVHVVNSRGGYIDDNDQVLDLLPEDIAEKALDILNEHNLLH
ncbi:glycosyltransferase family 9 protein [Cognaticolwellia mytili]|uniref:glycosyltransferase family 9 protein n=1 Tax=Cognaticolwellia mytili TaxID=1888913 RepID=UPI000A17806B|nr:glycosyltransferase family 9 protein [Cognaticolwellia mytili]